ncbi:MAG: hypothetical protein IJD81_01900 [Oscillospiraceae bacterium]|nr:hypothetical protein [Oscillospiraceae bacterium]
MKKNALALCTVLIGVLLLGLLCRPANRDIEYCTEINRLIQSRDFVTARVSEGEICLYDENDAVIETIAFEGYNRRVPLVYIRREESSLFFVTAGSVDDESGFLFVNDGADSLLDGIKLLERVGGNSYYYSTR